MIVQLNLLPDVKLEFIKTQRIKRMVMVVSGLVSAAVLIVTLLLAGSVYGIQKKYLGDLSKDITVATDNLTGTADLNKILTVQNQLASLPALHEQKPVGTRLFEYLDKLIPTTVTIDELNVNFVDNNIEITGGADTIASINKLVDTIKFTTYSEKDNPETPLAFSQVVLAEFSRSTEVTYKVTFKYDPAIFDGTKNDLKKHVELKVPNITSSRSEVEKPSAIIKQNSGSN